MIRTIVSEERLTFICDIIDIIAGNLHSSRNQTNLQDRELIIFIYQITAVFPETAFLE